MEKNLDNIAIGERIRAIREDIPMSREKFSEMIDISDVFLGQIERGECSLSLKTLASIVSFTGSSTDFILFGNPSDNSNIKRIERMLNRSSEDTINLIYTLIHDIYSYNRKMAKNKHQ